MQLYAIKVFLMVSVCDGRFFLAFLLLRIWILLLKIFLDYYPLKMQE